MRRVLAVALWVLGASSISVHAEPPALNLEPSPLTCLSVPDRKALAYPAQDGGSANAVVRVGMAFVAADQPPEVTVLSNTAGASFADAVIVWVRAYRLPCLEPGRQVAVNQTFDFAGSKPAEHRAVAFRARPAWLQPSDQGCKVAGLGTPPVYPRGVVARAAVIVRLDFAAADAAPQVTVLYGGDQPAFARAVLRVAEAYRLRCAKPLAAPVVGTQTFNFEMDGVAGTRLNESLTLQQVLGLVERLDAQNVRFDLTRMACPFDMKFSPQRPYASNAVDADLANHPERIDFVEWMRELVLALPPAAQRSAIGRETKVAVPCVVLDLT